KRPFGQKKGALQPHTRALSPHRGLPGKYPQGFSLRKQGIAVRWAKGWREESPVRGVLEVGSRELTDDPAGVAREMAEPFPIALQKVAVRHISAAKGNARVGKVIGAVVGPIAIDAHIASSRPFARRTYGDADL